MTPGPAFLSWLGQALVVALGWYVVDRLSAGRDRDRARREAVIKAADELSGAISKLLADARAYHSAIRNINAELLIKLLTQDISLQLSALSEIVSNTSLLAQCRSKVVTLRRTITGKHFEDEHLEPLMDGDQQHQEIAEAALDLKRVLLRMRHHQFAL